MVWAIALEVVIIRDLVWEAGWVILVRLWAVVCRILECRVQALQVQVWVR